VGALALYEAGICQRDFAGDLSGLALGALALHEVSAGGGRIGERARVGHAHDLGSDPVGLAFQRIVN
jgi:hypothetical protein